MTREQLKEGLMRRMQQEKEQKRWEAENPPTYAPVTSRQPATSQRRPAYQPRSNCSTKRQASKAMMGSNEGDPREDQHDDKASDAATDELRVSRSQEYDEAKTEGQTPKKPKVEKHDDEEQSKEIHSAQQEAPPGFRQALAEDYGVKGVLLRREDREASRGSSRSRIGCCEASATHPQRSSSPLWGGARTRGHPLCTLVNGDGANLGNLPPDSRG